ncbi:hypothetical protein AB0911_33435 [Streptomyces nigra]
MIDRAQLSDPMAEGLRVEGGRDLPCLVRADDEKVREALCRSYEAVGR